jgi:hypothetical protein
LDHIIEECFTDYEPAYFRALFVVGAAVPVADGTSFSVFTRTFAMFLNKCQKMSRDAVIVFLDLVGKLLKDKTKVISQHGLEVILAIVCKMASISGPSFTNIPGHMNEPSEASHKGSRGEISRNLDNADEIFVRLCGVVSSVLLFHRHRINGRHHLVVSVFTSLLKCLTRPIASQQLQQCAPWVHEEGSGLSQACAVAYTRILSNLCEPPVQAIREKGGKSNLTSSTQLAKHALAKHVAAILVCYIAASLHVGFHPEIRNALRMGFYSVFDVLGQEGLKTATALMDFSSRAYFKTLYDDYMAHGKWKEE